MLWGERERGKMHRITTSIIVTAMVVCTAACKPTDTAANARITALQQQVSKVRADLKFATAQIATLQQEISHPVAMYGTVFLDPSEQSFQRLDAISGLGTFAVSIGDVQPYGDGVRIKLNIGNISDTTFNDAKLTLMYGKRMPFGKPGKNWAAWSASMQTKKISLTRPLLPGNWNPTYIVLPQIKPSDFGLLEVSISTSQILLMKGGAQ